MNEVPAEDVILETKGISMLFLERWRLMQWITASGAAKLTSSLAKTARANRR